MARSRRKRPVRGQRRVRRKRSRVTASSIQQAEFVALEADEPFEKNGRAPRQHTEYIGHLIHRAWTDDGGLVHHAIYAYDSWNVVCDTPDFLRKVRAVGGNKLRISCDTVTCLWCIQRLLR